MTIVGNAKWLPSPFHTPGRQGAQITDIVLHWMDGTLANTDAEFAHGSRRVSAHYGIEGTTVHNYVRDADTAWHAGDWGENCRSIGIEHSADPKRPASALTITTSVSLMVELAHEHNINPDHVYGHKKFYATACPGTLPIAAMIASVKAQLRGPASPIPPVLTTTPEVDMPLSDADIHKVSTDVWNRFKIHTATGDVTLAVALSQLLGATNPTALAAAVAKAMPATGVVTQAQLEAALRTVLGSVDGTP